MASKLYGVNATMIIFMFVLYCIVYAKKNTHGIIRVSSAHDKQQHLPERLCQATSLLSVIYNAASIILTLNTSHFAFSLALYYCVHE